MRHTGAESADIWEENLTCSKVVSFGDAVNENEGVARWLREHAVIERVNKK